MALTINNFVGFETQGFEEASSISSPSPAIGFAPGGARTGTGYAVLGVLDAAEHFVAIDPFVDVADAGDDQIIGFGIRWTSLDEPPEFTPTADIDFLIAREGASSDALRLRLEATTRDLILVDANGTEIATVTDPFTVSTWHYVELRWRQVDTGAVADVFIDGVSVISVTGQDFTLSGGALTYVFFRPAPSGPSVIFIDDIYMLSGATSTADFLGKFTEVVGPYNKTDGGATELGDALDVGTWALASEVPVDDANGARGDYTGTPRSGGMQTDSGTRSGPSGDLRIDGDANIKAAKWIWWLRRGGGGGTTHKVRYGNSADGMTDRTISPGGSFSAFQKVSVAATEVPLSTEFFQIGMAVTGAKDLRLGDAWAMLLHVADAVAGDDVDEEGAASGVW